MNRFSMSSYTSYKLLKMVRFMAYMLVRRKTDYLHLLTFAINKLYFGVFRVIVD